MVEKTPSSLSVLSLVELLREHDEKDFYKKEKVIRNVTRNIYVLETKFDINLIVADTIDEAIRKICETFNIYKYIILSALDFNIYPHLEEENTLNHSEFLYKMYSRPLNKFDIYLEGRTKEESFNLFCEFIGSILNMTHCEDCEGFRCYLYNLGNLSLKL